jgi:hypothetical protein
MPLYPYNLEKAIDSFAKGRSKQLKISLDKYNNNSIMSIILLLILIQASKLSYNTL